jgi:cation transport ATPase
MASLICNTWNGKLVCISWYGKFDLYYLTWQVWFVLRDMVSFLCYYLLLVVCFVPCKSWLLTSLFNMFQLLLILTIIALFIGLWCLHNKFIHVLCVGCDLFFTHSCLLKLHYWYARTMTTYRMTNDVTILSLVSPVDDDASHKTL